MFPRQLHDQLRIEQEPLAAIAQGRECSHYRNFPQNQSGQQRFGKLSFVVYQHVSTISWYTFTSQYTTYLCLLTPSGTSLPDIPSPGRSTRRGIETGPGGCIRIASHITACR